jgi:small subunit ribosomal protein S13
MLQVAGFIIPDNKSILYSLTYIFAIGLKTSLNILLELKINQKTKGKFLTIEEKNLIFNYLEYKQNLIGLNLKNLIYQNIDKLITIRSYRGLRHYKNLPVRGQRTRTNSRTNRIYKKLKKKKNKLRYIKPISQRKNYEIK